MRNDEWISKFHHEFENSFAEDNRLRPIKFTSGYGYSIVGFYDKRHKRHMGMDKTIHYAPMYKFYVDEKKSSDNEHIPLFISVATTVEEQEDGEKRYMLTYKKIKRFSRKALNDFTK